MRHITCSKWPGVLGILIFSNISQIMLVMLLFFHSINSFYCSVYLQLYFHQSQSSIKKLLNSFENSSIKFGSVFSCQIVSISSTWMFLMKYIKVLFEYSSPWRWYSTFSPLTIGRLGSLHTYQVNSYSHFLHCEMDIYLVFVVDIPHIYL